MRKEVGDNYKILYEYKPILSDDSCPPTWCPICKQNPGCCDGCEFCREDHRANEIGDMNKFCTYPDTLIFMNKAIEAHIARMKKITQNR